MFWRTDSELSDRSHTGASFTSLYSNEDNESRPYDEPLPPLPLPPPVALPRNPAYLIEAKNGAVATENEVCSKMGVKIMKV